MRRLLEKGADTRMPPSSMTKLMTIYLVYERLKQGKMKLDDQLMVSEKAWHMGGSKMFVQIGAQVRRRGPDQGPHRRFRQRRLHRARRGDRRLGRTVRRHDECQGEAAWADQHELPQLHRLARSGSVHVHAAISPRWHMRIISDFPEYYHYDSEKTFKYNNIEQQQSQPSGADAAPPMD